MADTRALKSAAPATRTEEPVYREHNMRAPIEWEADEYAYSEKSNDWYWALGLIAVAGAVAALLFNNVLFAIIILVGSFGMALFASRKPERVRFAVTQRGIRVGDELYPYQSLKSFNVDQVSPRHSHKLLVESKRLLTPLMVIPIEGADPDLVHDYLLDFLPEDDHMEPFAHRIMEWLGF